MAIDMFDTRTMLGIVNEGETANTTFLRDRYFTHRPTFNTTKIDIDVIGKGKRKLAPWVHPKIGGIVVDREGFQTKSYEAPELSPMRVTTAEDMLKRSPGETIYSGKDPSARAAEQLGRDLGELDELITRREEVMCAEALLDGQVTIKGEGYDEVIRFWQPDDPQTTTVATSWSEAEATAIMKDLRDFRRNMIQKSGITPSEIICGTDVIDAIVEKLAAANALDNRRVDLGQINPQHLPDGVTYWGYLKDSALDIYSYDAWYLDEDGNDTAFIPSKKVLMASPKAKTSLAYGCVSLAGDDTVRFYEGSRVPDSWVQRANPSGRIVQIKSRPLAIVHQIHGFHTITAVK